MLANPDAIILWTLEQALTKYYLYGTFYSSHASFQNVAKTWMLNKSLTAVTCSRMSHIICFTLG